MKQFLRYKKLINTFSTLKGRFDEYQGYHVDLTEPVDSQQFKQSLIQTLQEFASQNVTAMWINLNPSQLNLSSTIVEQGFKMHYCTEQQLVFSKWLVKDMENRLPAFTSHQVGAGGLIIHKNKVLLVQEKNGRKKGQWGIINGQIQGDELIMEGAIREVKEETNLDVEVKGIYNFREVPRKETNSGDFYFIILMEMKNPDQEIIISEAELMNYKWLPINEIESFLEQNKVGFFQRKILQDVAKDGMLEASLRCEIGIMAEYGRQSKYAIYKGV